MRFAENETLIGALARLLFEDRKKSTELATNIVEMFLCFAQYSQFHSILITNKLGDSSIKILELELQCVLFTSIC